MPQNVIVESDLTTDVDPGAAESYVLVGSDNYWYAVADTLDEVNKILTEIREDPNQHREDDGLDHAVPEHIKVLKVATSAYVYLDPIDECDDDVEEEATVSVS